MTLKIEFEEQVWAQIIDMLAEHPFKRSGAIINMIAQQIQSQQLKATAGNGAAVPDQDQARPRGN